MNVLRRRPKDVLAGDPVRRVQLALKREPRDLWIGVYWDRPMPLDMGYGFELRTLFVYLCVIPCLPLKFTFSRVKPERERNRPATAGGQ
jgi:hypothetical protein